MSLRGAWQAEPSTLYVVATPIGNLDDLSARASDLLRSVAWVAAEDTRRTRTLLAHLGAAARLRSLHAGNEARMTSALLRALRSGGAGALVSDAGTPLISDPGRRLVAAALAAGLAVVPVPGASAPAAALSAAGLAADRFVFEGFLPARAAARRARLAELAREQRTWVAFEAPHRIRALAQDLKAALPPQRHVVWLRELTKRHEEILRGAVGALDPGRLAERGEYAVVVEGADAPCGVAEETLDRFLAPLLEQDVAVRLAAGLAHDCLGVPRRAAYQRALALSAKRRG